MDFLAACARRLDEGEDAALVVADLRRRYTTVRCLSVKMSLVRGMCTPTPEFTARAAGDEALLSGRARPPPDFPPRLAANVAAFRLSREDAKACKRLRTASAVHKNRRMLRVDGRRILRACRDEVDEVNAGRRAVGPTLVLAVMLLTGRRTCEIVNGRSTFSPSAAHAITFLGQAKKRHGARVYVVPCLHRAEAVLEALRRVREWTSVPAVRAGVSVNQAASRKYQSWLRRTLLAHDVLRGVGRVHGLRGLYARMAYRLFEWAEDFSEAYVVMHILGHAELTESLVYTACHLGDDFRDEPRLGVFDGPLGDDDGDAHDDGDDDGDDGHGTERNDARLVSRSSPAEESVPGGAAIVLSESSSSAVCNGNSERCM